MFKECEVTTIRIDLHCDECGTGMRKTEMTFLVRPVIYQYVCDKCGNEQRERTSYPKIEYRKKHELDGAK